jgi:predicted Zn-dependent peptidase
MTVDIAQGVKLHIIPSQKFKTVSMKIKFTSPLKKETITKRALIANLLDTNSKYYPTQTDFRKALSELYGAQFGTGVSKKGNLHPLSVYMSVVNDRYLSETGVVEGAIRFLQNILLHPHAFHGAFHKETFKREQQNLRDEYDARYDNKQLYANLALKELYFNDEKQQIPSDGRLTELEECTPENVYQAYKEMIEQDQIDIYVLGDVKEEEIISAFRSFGFVDRTPHKETVFYQNNKREKKEKVETQSIVQAKLNIGYETGIYYHQEEYYAAQVFNGIFGGYPHSKLFMNVREKESLAYYASSSMDTFRGALFVQTGIDQNKASYVEEMVQKQLEDIQAGEFSDEALEQTKQMIKNGLEQSADSAQSIIELRYAMDLIEQTLTISEWIERIEAVNREDIIQVAKRIKPRATFLLKGEDEK